MQYIDDYNEFIGEEVIDEGYLTDKESRDRVSGKMFDRWVEQSRNPIKSYFSLLIKGEKSPASLSHEKESRRRGIREDKDRYFGDTGETRIGHSPAEKQPVTSSNRTVGTLDIKNRYTRLTNRADPELMKAAQDKAKASRVGGNAAAVASIYRRERDAAKHANKAEAAAKRLADARAKANSTGRPDLVVIKGGRTASPSSNPAAGRAKAAFTVLDGAKNKKAANN